MDTTGYRDENFRNGILIDCLRGQIKLGGDLGISADHAKTPKSKSGTWQVRGLPLRGAHFCLTCKRNKIVGRSAELAITKKTMYGQPLASSNVF